MSAELLRYSAITCLLLVLCSVNLDAEVYRDRPRIKTNNGHFIIQPATGKNIYLQTNGPQSAIFVGGVNILNLNGTGDHTEYQPSDIDLNYLDGPRGILRRLERLERQQDYRPNYVFTNVSMLRRTIHRLSMRVDHLQSIVDSMGSDQCRSRPCVNGGTCLSLTNGFHCLCPSNWEGKDCSVDVNECRIYRGTDLGCQNGANCKNTPGSYECECKSGWYGLHCTRRNKDCSGGDFEMCGHGTCVPINTGQGIKCICDQGWTTNVTGEACHTDINECEASQGPRCSVNPKVECINLPGSFRCGQCPVGYEGDGYICSDIDECLTIPNGGCSTSPLVTCHNTVGSRICGPCPVGYDGDGITCTWRGSCNINNGGCHPSAQCVENSQLAGQVAQCVCPPGMAGDGVGLQGCYIPTANFTRGCDSNPCGIHGQCHPLRAGYNCICYRGYGGARCEVARDSCSSNPCLHGGVCRADFLSTGGFRCECPAQYSGDRCHVPARPCGGVLRAAEGTIVYPLNKTSYNNNVRCAWVIHINPDKVINVTFSKFNLEQNPECLYDFLQIHDGNSAASQIIGRFCGNEFPKGGNIISSHNKMYFWFRTDQTVTKDGFALHWESIDPVCGGEINAITHGRISSPGSPGKYPPNRDCYWHLSTVLGKRIQLHFFSLDIEVHSNCSYDFVAIYDGAETRDPLIGKYCNSTHPEPVTSAGSDLLLHFHSDADGAGYGFQVAFAPADGVPGCGGFYTTDRGEIASPSYEGKYLSNVICEYKIKTKLDTRVRLDFKSFVLERSQGCFYDYVAIYDGQSQDSPFVGKFCGRTYPKTYTSSTNEVYIKFKSDHTVSEEGFRITFKSVCLHTITGDSGIVKSPGYPFQYPKNIVCEYVIGTAPGKVIQLKFQEFDVENNDVNSNCLYDNVEVRDGMNVNHTLLGQYCGGIEHIPSTLTSTQNYMYIKLNSDMSNTGTGFYANFTTVAVECGGVYTADNGTINHPSADKTRYSGNQYCTWMIIAPDGMFIKLTWNRFGLELMPSCRSDFVTIREVGDDGENIDSDKYCGHDTPPVMTSSTNKLQIIFQSDSSVESEGFSLSYKFMDPNTHCGGAYFKSHGFIYSPGWPKRYPNSQDCTWIIRAPTGQQIMLNITQFRLEKTNWHPCYYADYLEIRNGLTENSPLINQFCGTFETKVIKSMNNALFLRFHSDSYMTGGGFKIEWDSTITGCGGTLSSPAGSITSPNYPLNYNNDAECFYKIVTSHGARVKISFTELVLERTHNCRDDYVEIFDGRDDSSPSLGKYCYYTDTLSDIKSTSNYVFIKFRSDSWYTAKGFVIQYNTICENNVTGFYGIIESPGYPAPYSFPLNCVWFINVPKGNRINVTFTDFDMPVARRINWYPTTGIQQHSWREVPFHNYDLMRRVNGNAGNVILDCADAFLQYKDSLDNDFRKKICGTSAPRISTKGNSLQVKFTSVQNNYYVKRGFRLEWARYGCGGYLQKVNGRVQVDSSLTSNGDLECEWLIETRAGSSVILYVTELYMADTVNCTTDAIEIYNGRFTNAPLITKVCHHPTGGSSFSSSTNYMLIKFVKTSSLKDVHFTARFYSGSFGCGGRLETLTGMVHSTNYPKNYDNNMNCMWTIVVPQNHRIQLQFIDLDLYTRDVNDCGDSVSIYEGIFILDKNYTKRVCGQDQTTSAIVSKTNILGVQFISDNYGTAKGFKANFTVICGATIKASYDGIIANDKWHASHILDNCTWTILAPSLDQKISLTITHMSIPKDSDIVTNRKCPSSFLRVYDGDDTSAPMVEEYCGRRAPPMIVSRGSAITLLLGAYNGTAQGQFSAYYSALSTTCGGLLTSEEGSITSPNYPLSYPGNITCEWVLETSPGNRVYITFEQFDLEWSENCNEDYLEVRETDGGGNLLGVYCGSEIPTNTSTSTQLYLRFHSNGANNGRGFIVHYGFLHGNEIIGLTQGEITSPLYPHPYDGSGEYSWRIIVEGLVAVVIDRAEITAYGTTCDSNSLTVYDGYDDEAPILEEFCGILKTRKELKSTSNTVFIKLKLDEPNTGSIFHITWTKADTESTESSGKPNCGFNETKTLTPGEKVSFTSPNYPESYTEGLSCEWVFGATSGRHVNLHFNTFKLEETPMCFADSVSVYSSSSPSLWKPVKENICTSSDVQQDLNSTTYMKIVFKTDLSVEREGFEAIANSACGGLLTETSGTIEPRIEDIVVGSSLICHWTIKVRPGRTILLNFEHFNITNPTNHKCDVYVVIRNGDSIEAPMLADGKYCGSDHERHTGITSTSNSVFVKYYFGYLHTLQIFQNFRLRYEEKGSECGLISKLDDNHKWEVFTSPNYPSVPSPYSECVWVFTAPPGEFLNIDFLDRFDLDTRDECALEYVEIRDGSTDLAPTKGRYCKDKPSTIKTAGNTVYVKYYTQLLEPRNGFKANVSIGVCGGTIIESRGEITSPGYPHLPSIPPGTVCQWRLISSQKLTFLIEPQDIDLPESATYCGTKVTIQEKESFNNTVTILNTYCGEQKDMSAVQSSSHEVTITLQMGQPSRWDGNTNKKGFRFRFKSSIPKCGRTVTTPEGYLTTPGYPRDTALAYCVWNIIVPDKTRRVRLVLLDADMAKHRIFLYNDDTYRTLIAGLSNRESLEHSTVFESSGNELTITLLRYLVSGHRFKAKFSSSEAALCGGELSGARGELDSPGLNRSYTCKWSYRPTIPIDTTIFNTLFIMIQVNSTTSTSRFQRTTCAYHDAKITINNIFLYNTIICGNVEKSFVLPSSGVKLIATKNTDAYLHFHLEWKLNPCGGTIVVGGNAINVLNIPDDYNDTIDCLWKLRTEMETPVQIKLEGSFQQDCEQEFVKIASIGDYCRDKMQDKPLMLQYGSLLVRYHSHAKTDKSKNRVRVMVNTIADECGGILTDYNSVFESPHFPKQYDPNVECTWEIKSNLGDRISLSFVERFAIEDKPNCTKDAVIIYDWKDEGWVETTRLCGRSLPPTFTSARNRLKVVFRTDASTQLEGFKAVWTTTCGGQYNVTDKPQYLYSPGGPNVYLPNMNCTYEFLGHDNKISIKFLEFSLEGTYPDCQYDNLTFSSVDDYYDQTYCGSTIPILSHNYKHITMTFKTDHYIQSKGFKLVYQFYECGAKVQEPTIISSTVDSDGDSYETDANCTWVIEAPEHKIVVVKFQEIDLESRSNCWADYLAVFDAGVIDNDKQLAIICGHVSLPTPIRSTGNKMVVQFVSDSSVSGKGFKAGIYFSYSSSVGCGGEIDLTDLSPGDTRTLKSPLINGSVVYENFLDCHWIVRASADNIVNIKFKQFHIAPCYGVNQTATGYNKCDCDYVELVDGANPNDLVINRFCGHNKPENKITSSGEFISLRLYTDGEIASSGFEAELSVQPSVCGQRSFNISQTVQVVKSPGYEMRSIPRGLSCIYTFDTTEDSAYDIVHITIKNLDLRPGEPDSNQCNKDRIIIMATEISKNVSLGKDFTVTGNDGDSFLNYYYEDDVRLPDRHEYCGKKVNVSLYLNAKHVTVHLVTSPESGSFKGVEFEVVLLGVCGRNYTELQGRIVRKYTERYDKVSECYTLISVPENYTISLYFLHISLNNWGEEGDYLEILDGDKPSSPKLSRIGYDYDVNTPVFSNGRQLLLHSRFTVTGMYDLVYVATDKGRGCGGSISGLVGRLTSPLYPEVYRQRGSCEWQLETSAGTKLRLQFPSFDLGAACDTNYVQLVDRAGGVFATYCAESPAVYTSPDNYVKIVFTTTRNNAGTGWVAEFIGVAK